MATEIVFLPWKTLDKEAREKFKFANRAAGLRPDKEEVGDDVHLLTINGVRVGFIASGGALPPFYFWMPYDDRERYHVACFSQLYGYWTELEYLKFRRYFGNNKELFTIVDEFIKHRLMKR